MTTDAGQQGAAPDPSMEDILASIRRILDEEGKPKGDEPNGSVAQEGVQEPVLELDESMMVPEPDEVSAGPIPPPPMPRTEPAMVREPVVAAPAMSLPVPVPVSAAERDPGLVAPAAAAAAAMSVGALMRTLASERSVATHRGGPTIEDLVREEIRPLLKDWLDTHLAPMVERLVRSEIERVVSRTP